MNIKRILLITVIAVAILASVSVVSAGLFDGLFGGEQQDNVIELDEITFNTTNATDFKEDKAFQEKYYHEILIPTKYNCDNGTGYSGVLIFDYSRYDSNSADEEVRNKMMDTYKNYPYQNVNGIVVYTSSLTDEDCKNNRLQLSKDGVEFNEMWIKKEQLGNQNYIYFAYIV